MHLILMASHLGPGERIRMFPVRNVDAPSFSFVRTFFRAGVPGDSKNHNTRFAISSIVRHGDIGKIRGVSDARLPICGTYIKNAAALLVMSILGISIAITLFSFLFLSFLTGASSPGLLRPCPPHTPPDNIFDSLFSKRFCSLVHSFSVFG